MLRDPSTGIGPGSARITIEYYSIYSIFGDFVLNYSDLKPCNRSPDSSRARRPIRSTRSAIRIRPILPLAKTALPLAKLWHTRVAVSYPTRFTIRVNDDIAIRAVHRAKQLGCTPTELCRALVEQGLDMPPPTVSMATTAAVGAVRRRAFSAVANALRQLEMEMQAEIVDEISRK